MSQQNKVTFTRWCDIEQLHNLVTSIKKSKAQLDSKGEAIHPFEFAFDKEITYRGKIKLHGSNAAITLQYGQARPQSRNQFLDDASGMGKILNKNKDFFLSLCDDKKKITIFGEYAGKGVQPKVALSMLNVNVFAIFAIQFDDDWVMVEPEQITAFLTRNSTQAIPEHIYVLPWQTPTYTLNFLDEKSLTVEADKINVLVQQIDAEDPWVLQHFNKKGHGEGLVLYPISFCNAETSFIPRELFGEFVFKAKGASHQVVKLKAPAQIAPSSASNIDQFVDLLVTEARLEQGVGEVGGILDAKKTGEFVNWIKNDVQKEGNDELEASKLNWKEVLPAVSKKASAWYSEKVKKSKS